MAISMLSVMAANVLDDGSLSVRASHELSVRMHQQPLPMRLDNILPIGTLDGNDGVQGWWLRSSTSLE